VTEAVDGLSVDQDLELLDVRELAKTDLEHLDEFAFLHAADAILEFLGELDQRHIVLDLDAEATHVRKTGGGQDVGRDELLGVFAFEKGVLGGDEVHPIFGQAGDSEAFFGVDFDDRVGVRRGRVGVGALGRLGFRPHRRGYALGEGARLDVVGERSRTHCA